MSFSPPRLTAGDVSNLCQQHNQHNYTPYNAPLPYGYAMAPQGQHWMGHQQMQWNEDSSGPRLPALPPAESDSETLPTVAELIASVPCKGKGEASTTKASAATSSASMAPGDPPAPAPATASAGARSGRAHGAKSYSPPESTALAKPATERAPLGAVQWTELAKVYNQWATEQGFSEHADTSLKDKFDKVCL
jgi:hypothetical protein